MHRTLVVATLVLCPPVLGQDTVSFRGNAGHTGVYDAPGTATFHKIKWQVHTLRTLYTLAVEPVRAELQRILKESNLWNGKTCVLQVTDFTETTMQLRRLMSANSSSMAFDLRCHVRERMIHFLQEHYPQCLPTRRDAVTLEPAAAPSDGQPPNLPHRTL